MSGLWHIIMEEVTLSLTCSSGVIRQLYLADGIDGMCFRKAVHIEVRGVEASVVLYGASVWLPGVPVRRTHIYSSAIKPFPAEKRMNIVV